MTKKTLNQFQTKEIERVCGKDFEDADIPSFWKEQEREEQSFFHEYWAEFHGAVCDENGWRV